MIPKKEWLKDEDNIHSAYLQKTRKKEQIYDPLHSNKTASNKHSQITKE
jgi:hypothetical protein